MFKKILVLVLVLLMLVTLAMFSFIHDVWNGRYGDLGIGILIILGYIISMVITWIAFKKTYKYFVKIFWISCLIIFIGSMFNGIAFTMMICPTIATGLIVSYLRDYIMKNNKKQDS